MCEMRFLLEVPQLRRGGSQEPRTQLAYGIDCATPKAILIWEEVMPTLVGFGTHAALPERQISEKISRRILSGDQGMLGWRSIGAGVHVEPHSSRK